MADYYNRMEEFPVKPESRPGDIYKSIPDAPPEKPESMDRIFRDFREIILPGMTHWQHPHFHAYFTANSSYPSVLGEMLTATLAAQCMMWDTSPAAAELEEKTMNWLKGMLGLPAGWSGSIQDTASTSTLVSLLSAREKHTGFNSNKSGLYDNRVLRVYTSTEAHSSIEKAVKIAGLGQENLVRIPVDGSLAMIPEKLEESIVSNLANGFIPMAVVLAMGTTGTVAVDPLRPVAEICNKHQVWLHVDAAYAGSALVLKEYRWMADGLEMADSFVFNPHKWMFTNFDLSAYFVRDPELLVKTFEVLPEYLKTKSRGVKNYRDWGIQLGRRFRALKLWFVIRDYGVQGIRDTFRKQIDMAKDLTAWLEKHPAFEVHKPQHLNVVCFRLKETKDRSPEERNRLNDAFLQKLNKTGKVFLSHTKVRGLFTLRVVLGQTRIRERHVEELRELLLGNLDD